MPTDFDDLKSSIPSRARAGNYTKAGTWMCITTVYKLFHAFMLPWFYYTPPFPIPMQQFQFSKKSRAPDKLHFQTWPSGPLCICIYVNLSTLYHGIRYEYRMFFQDCLTSRAFLKRAISWRTKLAPLTLWCWNFVPTPKSRLWILVLCCVGSLNLILFILLIFI